MLTKLIKYAFIFTFLFILAIKAPAILAKTESAIVDSKSLNVRSGPGLSYEVTATLNKDQKVDILSTSGDWLEIKTGDKTGWIASWYTVNTKKSNSKIISNVNSLNVRSGPSINSTVLEQMSAGDEAALFNTDGDWAQVHINGKDGWVHTDYISIVNKEKMDKPNNASDLASSFTVAVDALNVRQKSDLSSKRVDLISKGKTYKVKEIDGNWVQIELGNGKDGWVYSFHGTLSSTEALESANNSSPKVVNILSNGTNIRKEAKTSSEVVLRANAGERFDIVAEVNEWYELKLASGETAFVANWVVSVDEEKENPLIPAVEKVNRVPGTLNGLTIVIDPGHGGKDMGSTGYHGTNEKDLTLLTSNLLAEKLRKAGATVKLTRESDVFIPLPQRVSMSHQYAADAFVSIHYDASVDSSISGFTTYYTAGREDKLATAVNNGLDSSLTIRNRGAQPGNYHVIRENRQIGILVELGFLSNSIEENMVNTKSFREQASHGIYNGLLSYFDSQLK